MSMLIMVMVKLKLIVVTCVENVIVYCIQLPLYTYISIFFTQFPLGVFSITMYSPYIKPRDFATMTNVTVLLPLVYSAIDESVNSAATHNQLGLLDCY